jgi:hypothetical protein
MDIQSLIGIFKKYTEMPESISEQEGDAAPASAPASGGATGGGSKYPTVTKWESGIQRGPSNQVGVTKWADVVGSKLTRGKANQLTEQVLHSFLPC